MSEINDQKVIVSENTLDEMNCRFLYAEIWELLNKFVRTINF